MAFYSMPATYGPTQAVIDVDGIYLIICGPLNVWLRISWATTVLVG